jgi:hypothetical protein
VVSLVPPTMFGRRNVGVFRAHSASKTVPTGQVVRKGAMSGFGATLECAPGAGQVEVSDLTG